MQTALKVKLSIFMFLQYFIWGSWYASMGAYLATTLKFDGREIGAAYGAFAIGSMISPFFVGLVADRYFASEKLLGVLGLLGAAAISLIPRAETFGEFYPLLILYCATFAPTLALGNSLALHHLRDAKRHFPRVKILSAVGWIAGGVAVSRLPAPVPAPASRSARASPSRSFAVSRMPPRLAVSPAKKFATCVWVLLSKP